MENIKHIIFSYILESIFFNSQAYSRGAICRKTGKTLVLPRFWKIEDSGGSGAAIIGVLPGLGASGAPEWW